LSMIDPRVVGWAQNYDLWRGQRNGGGVRKQQGLVYRF
jgi:hypothetical protein